MEFVVVVLALIIERFLHIDTYIFRFNWFQTYINKLQKTFSRTELFSGVLGLIIIVLPVLIVVSIVYYLLHSLFWGFAGFILATVILIYCLGPRDFHTRFEAYFVAVVRDDTEAKEKAAAKLLCIVPEDSKEIPRALTKSVFNHFNYEIFTVIFWFLFFGPVAAVLYRTVAEVHKYAHCKNSPLESMLPSATWVMQIIEWLPLRVMALGFALMGDFQKSFNYWLKYFASPIKDNYKYTQAVGLAALGITHGSDGTHDMAEVKAALRLVERTLILFVVITALFVLGAIIY